jgi:hypothetical protein
MAADFLRTWFPGIRRAAPAGAADLGDLLGVEDLTLQVKGAHAMTLSKWVLQAEVQSVRARTRFYAVIHRRWGKAPGQWYVTMPLVVFANLYTQTLEGSHLAEGA